MHEVKRFLVTESEQSTQQSPYKRVVNAVLMQAADDLRAMQNRLRERRFPQPHMIEAALWVESDEDRPFSFVWCCDIVGRDSGVTRKKMLGPINMQRLKEAMRL